jgi:hypothetical protein
MESTILAEEKFSIMKEILKAFKEPYSAKLEDKTVRWW